MAIIIFDLVFYDQPSIQKKKSINLRHIESKYDFIILLTIFSYICNCSRKNIINDIAIANR
ncbi:hypothetical protein DERF_008947 [Dermatophagoides farinae]|uniref:Uncharacterized protein n=1 Tax=Dermatophagoides farinae TaxID=6954 RepID=A0A922L574_DERFA|nr:hypothetical protein DERF_008947 [Dermatophagoides farinae]